MGRVPLDKPREVLLDRANEIIASLGYGAQPGAHAHGMLTAPDYLQWLRTTRRGPDRWDPISVGNPAAVLHWYRTSPREMVPLLPPDVRPHDPPVTETDMRVIVLDMRGRLREFRSVRLNSMPRPSQETRLDGTSCSRPRV